jgi:hypothetical protein
VHTAKAPDKGETTMSMKESNPDVASRAGTKAGTTLISAWKKSAYTEKQNTKKFKFFKGRSSWIKGF